MWRLWNCWLTDTSACTRIIGMRKRNKELVEAARALAEARWKGVAPEERARVARAAVEVRWKKATEQDRQAAAVCLEKVRKKRWPKIREKVSGTKTRR